MVIFRQSEPVQIYYACVAGSGSNGHADLRSAAAAKLLKPRNVSDDDVGPWNSSNGWLGRQDILFYFAINHLCDLDIAHDCGDRYLSNHGPRFGRLPQLGSKFFRHQ